MQEKITPEELISIYKAGDLPEKMADRFGYMQDEQIAEIQKYLSDLHNTNKIDLLLLAMPDGIPHLQGTGFFLASQFFSKILLELDETPVRMMECIEALVLRGGNDGAANEPNATLREWCERDEERSNFIISSAHGEDELSIRHLTFALEAKKDTDEARRFVLNYTDARCLGGITALGRIKAGCNSYKEMLSTFDKVVELKSDDDLHGSMLNALDVIIADSSCQLHKEICLLMDKLLGDAGDFTLHQAARMLWSNGKQISEDMIDLLLESLININPENKGTINELDRGLKTLLELKHEEKVINFVTDLFTLNEDKISFSELDGVAREIVSGSSERLSLVVVKWLLLGSPALCEGLNNALNSDEIEGPILDIEKKHIPMSSEEQQYLCRKAIGWFFFKPRTAASILVSVLRICVKKNSENIQELLNKHLLINYASVTEYLKSISTNDSAKKRIDNILLKYKQYLNGLKKVPYIAELAPSENHRYIQHIRQQEQMQKVTKEARDKSVFLSLVKHSVMLYGEQSQSFIKTGDGNFQSMEIDLKAHSVSYELPRLDTVDPIGLDYTLRIFRAEKME